MGLAEHAGVLVQPLTKEQIDDYFSSAGGQLEAVREVLAADPEFREMVKTPLMLVLGEADYRTPPGAGGEEMFRALKFLKRPVIMVRFPGESHELSRSGQPWHRVERLQHIVGWFDKYLQGIDKAEYSDVTGQEISVKTED